MGNFPFISPLIASSISFPPTSTSSTIAPKSSSTAGAEALKKGSAQPTGYFYKAQKKYTRGGRVALPPPVAGAVQVGIYADHPTRFKAELTGIVIDQKSTTKRSAITTSAFF